ncbi:MAG: hypothetical protein C4530_11445 [Desulfobacteraceae bacterium]|nr:MAG: hypothetical protein C4530_11445 [Desulfobacteraceae bacterium]
MILYAYRLVRSVFINLIYFLTNHYTRAQRGRARINMYIFIYPFLIFSHAMVYKKEYEVYESIKSQNKTATYKVVEKTHFI